MEKQGKMRGLGGCALLAILAWWLGNQFSLIGAPVFAILLGMLVGFIWQPSSRYQNGIVFASKNLLQVAVVLLGFGLNLTQVLSVGQQSLPVIVTTVGTALVTAFLLQKVFHLDRDMATLVGVGTSICGGSAIAATAPVIEAKEEEVAKAISVIFLFNLVAAVLFPHLGQWLNLSDAGFALFAGTAVNDTSSVTATATTWDNLHQTAILETATVVKLTRTLAIIPITLGLSIYRARQSKKSSQNFSTKRVFPTFLLYFLLVSLLTSILGFLGYRLPFLALFKNLSRFFIVMAMAGIGLKTDIRSLWSGSRQAFYVGGTCWLVVILVSLLMQALLGLW